jgi:7-cyano-7-deazaguanine synthase in queuosine biosynthesis
MDLSQMYNTLRTPGKFYIPGYQTMVYLSAMCYADKIGSYGVYTGEQLAANDPHDYDNDPELKDYMQLIGHYSEETCTRARADLAAYYGKTFYPYADSGTKKTAFQFIDPLYFMTKAEGVRLGIALGAPLHLTRTCKNSEVAQAYMHKQQEFAFGRMQPDMVTPTHCGEPNCFFCKVRRQTFKDAGVADPTAYAKEE